MLGERAPDGRSREHPGQVEHTHTGQRAITATGGPRFAVSHLGDDDAPEGCERASLRMRIPLRARTHHRRATVDPRERVLELQRVPAPNRVRDLIAIRIVGDTEHRARARREVREPTVEMDPATVTRFVERGERQVAARHVGCLFGTVDALEQERDQRAGRGIHADAHRLLLTGAVAPDLGRERGSGADRHRRGFTDREPRREDGIATLDGDVDLGRRADLGEECGNPSVRHGARIVTSDRLWRRQRRHVVALG